MPRKILLGVTGSVAAVLTGKLTQALSDLGEVRLVVTDKGRYFTDHIQIVGATHIYFEQDEWRTPKGDRVWKQKDDPVVHIELRDWANVLVVAPLTANTMAKIRYGLCDNLLTSVIRAWERGKPMIAAPAMNTKMWEHHHTQEQIPWMRDHGWWIANPQSKELACGDKGMGAMAPIEEIVDLVARYEPICSDDV